MSQSGEYVSAQRWRSLPGYDLIRECGMPMEDFPIRSGVARYPTQAEVGSRTAERRAAGRDIELRQAIAGHLRFTRGIQADPEHIVIFSGSMQGLVLMFQRWLIPAITW